MNDNRFGRQTYKNLLSGLGSTLIGHNSDENVIMSQQNKTNLIKTSASTMSFQQQTKMISSSTTSSTTTATSATTTSFSSLTNASIRNALGDIGNRIGIPTNTNLAQKKDTKSVKIDSNQVGQVQESSNNSCIMLDEEELDKQKNQVEEVELETESEEELEPDESIIDIDKTDSENPQLVSEYVKDIYKYLTSMEKKYKINSNFLENKIVTTKMRSVLIDWLIQVHLKFHLLQETLYLCVQIIDAYLQVQDVPKMQLQLVGVTAMFLASKYEEMYVPAIDDFVYMTDNTYTKSEIRQMEISILKTLNFMFCKPLPLHFLRRFSKAGHADPKQHTLAKYFMELSLHDAEFSSMDPSYLAACSLCLSFKLLNGPEWNRQLEYYSTYKQAYLMAGMQKISKLSLKSMDNDYKYRAATNKYGASKFMRISLIPELGSSYMRELANANFKTK